MVGAAGTGGGIIAALATIDASRAQDAAASCGKTDVADHNSKLWALNVLPFVDMTVKGWLWYQ